MGFLPGTATNITAFTVLDIRFITTIRMAIFQLASGLMEYCMPQAVINLDIQHSSVQYLLNVL